MVRRVVTRAASLVCVAVTLASCAAAPPELVPEPATYLLSDGEIAAFSTLLRLEDRREYDAELMTQFAASSSPVVRERAALVLGRLEERTSVPTLETLLLDPDTAVAAVAAFALGEIGDSSAVPSLLHLIEPDLATAHPSVAAEAAHALGKIGSDRAGAALEEVLVSTPSESGLEELVNAALLATWKFPRPDDLGAITRWANSPDAGTRWRAVYALVRRSTPSAAPLLLERVNDVDPDVRALAVRGLTSANVDSAGLSSSDVIPVLVATLSDSSYSVRINAVRALGSYSPAASVDALTELLERSDPHIRIAAIESLGTIGSDAAAATDALTRIATNATAPVALRAAAMNALSRVSPPVAERLARSAADSEEWRLRAAAAQALARVSPSGTLLRNLMWAADGRVAASALGAALSAAGDSILPLRPVLISLLGAQDVVVRSIALRALARLEDPALLSLFLDAYGRARSDEQNDAAIAAVHALASLSAAGVNPGRAFFPRFGRSPDHLIRRTVKERFGSLPTEWGTVLPIETNRPPGFYQEIVEQWIVPALATGEKPRVRINTDEGVIEVDLYPVAAPLTVLNFVSLAEARFFDGQEWPRVVPNFVVQGGDPRGDMSGGPGYSIRDEMNRHLYRGGTLGMALSGPDTGGSQFFITHAPQPHLNGGYTVFGQLVSGVEIIRRLLPGDRILDAQLISVPKCLICQRGVSN